MAIETTCPICGFELTSTGQERCSQCDADLTCFTVLDSIPDEPTQASLRPMELGSGKRPTAIHLMLGAFSLLSVGLFTGFILAAIYRPAHPPVSLSYQHPLPVRIKMPRRIMSTRTAGNEHGDQKSPDMSQTVTEKKTDVPPKGVDGAAVLEGPLPAVETVENEGFSSAFHEMERNQKISGTVVPAGAKMPEEEELGGGAAQSRSTAFRATDQETFRIYEATEEDTLWRISKKEYGSGFYFPVLMESNPGIHIYSVHEGLRLKIYRDPAVAKKLYHENAQIQGDRAYYHYLVREGDTVESIASRFYKDDGMKERIMDLNPGVKLRAGMRIKIELE